MLQWINRLYGPMTFEEAQDFCKKSHIPEGWRLPTVKEIGELLFSHQITHPFLSEDNHIWINKENDNMATYLSIDTGILGSSVKGVKKHVILVKEISPPFELPFMPSFEQS